MIEALAFAICGLAGIATVWFFASEVLCAFREVRASRRDLELATEILEETIGAIDETRRRLVGRDAAPVSDKSWPVSEGGASPLAAGAVVRVWQRQASRAGFAQPAAGRAASLARSCARLLLASDTRIVATAATAVSILAWLYFNHRGDVLAYKDAVSHMEIARRIVDSPTTGFGQLGGVWLPLPHLLMLPLIWIDALYYSGLAGSVVSMASYVVTSVLLYKIVRDLTGRRTPAFVGASAFMANPNVLYMQSTPMTELLLFACMAGMVYLVQRWIVTENHVYLLGSGVVAFLGTLTRYEAWVLLAALTAVVIVVAWRKGYGRVKVEGLVLGFLFVAGLGVVGWLAWDQLIFGNALYFQDGKYAKPSLWVGAGDVAVGHWLIAAKTYWFAMIDNLDSIGVYLAIAGLAVFAARTRCSPRTWPVLSLLTMLPFFVVALEAGQRPLHVTQVTGDLYNVRFGLMMVLPAAIVVGYLADAPRLMGKFRIMPIVAVALLTLATARMTHLDRIVTLREAVAGQHDTYTERIDQAAAYLRKHWTHGLILMESYGNDSLLLKAHIPLAQNIYEGSYRLWSPALKNPRLHEVDEIVMRHSDPPDQVFTDLRGSDVLRGYTLSYANDGYYIYTRTTKT